jgi:hypothetical protein
MSRMQRRVLSHDAPGEHAKEWNRRARVGHLDLGLSFVEVDHSVVNPSHHALAPSLYFMLVNTLPRGCETEHMLPHIHDGAFITR